MGLLLRQSLLRQLKAQIGSLTNGVQQVFSHPKFPLASLEMKEGETILN